jgi:putative phage-type endonuclease
MSEWKPNENASFWERAVTFDNKEDWLKFRGEGYRLTGTSVAGILNASPWSSPWKIYNEKRYGIKEPISAEKQAIFDRGHIWEPRIMEEYTRITGRRVFDPGIMLVEHPKHEWLWGSPDGLIEGGGFEAKTSTKPEHWGESGTVITKWVEGSEKVIPAQYAIQCYVYMSVTELPFWDLAVALPVPFDFPQVRWFRIMRDEAVENAMLKKVAAWRDKHLIHGVRPEVDETEDCRAGLNFTFRSDSKTTRSADLDEYNLMVQYREAHEREKQAKEEKMRIGNILLNSIRTDYGLEFGGSKAIAVRMSGATTYDVKAIMEERPDLKPILEQNKKKGRDYTRVQVYGGK